MKGAVMENISTKIKLAGLGLLLLASTAFGQPGTFYEWLNPVSINWWNPLNWTPHGVPDSLDHALIGHNNPQVLADNRVVRILGFAGGNLSGQTLTVADSFRWWGGTLDGNIIIFISDTSHCKIDGLSGGGSTVYLNGNAQLINEGEAFWYGGNINFSGSGQPLLTNRNLFHIEPINETEVIMWSNFLNENGGVVTKTLPATVRFKNFFNTFNSYGHIDIQEGLFDISVPGTVSGTVAVSSPGELFISGYYQINLSDVDISGPGKVTFGSGINSSSIVISGNDYIDRVYIDNSELSGNGTLTVRDSMIVTGNFASVYNHTITVEPQAILWLDGELGTYLDTLYLLGNTRFTTNGSLGGGSNAVIMNRGTIDLADMGSIPGFTYSHLVNDSSGFINVNVYPGDVVNFTLSSFKTYGDVNILSGTMQLNTDLNAYSGNWAMGPGALVYFVNGNAHWHAGSEVHAQGTIRQTGGGNVFRFSGKVLPAGYAIGQLTLIPNYSVEFAPTTELIIQLGGTTPGTEYDQLIIDKNTIYGTISLDGTLDVRLYNSFAPALGDTFDIILHSEGYSGAFSDILLPVLPDPGLHLQLIQTDSLIRLAVTGTPTGIATGEDGTAVPDRFSLSQNYPNPFNPQTTIRYGLPKAAAVKIEIFNLLGQRVATLVEGQQQAGFHTVQWDASTQPSGVYLYRIEAGDFIQSKKMLLVR